MHRWTLQHTMGSRPHGLKRCIVLNVLSRLQRLPFIIDQQTLRCYIRGSKWQNISKLYDHCGPDWNVSPAHFDLELIFVMVPVLSSDRLTSSGSSGCNPSHHFECSTPAGRKAMHLQNHRSQTAFSCLHSASFFNTISHSAFRLQGWDSLSCWSETSLSSPVTEYPHENCSFGVWGVANLTGFVNIPCCSFTVKVFLCLSIDMHWFRKGGSSVWTRRQSNCKYVVKIVILCSCRKCQRIYELLWMSVMF